MSLNVPQATLDALTDVEMPRLPPEPLAMEMLEIAGYRVPCYRFACLIVGSGAAGLRAAVEMKRRGVDVAILSQSAWGGTSACSGSDKQTLHTANTADQGDNFEAMALAIRSGGAMDEDTAYVEAVGSPRAMASLQYLGLPLPQDALGGTLRYKTDHDEVGRATSCGPRTSRLMVKVLAKEAIGLGVAIFNQTTAVKVLVEGGEQDRRAKGVLALRGKDRSADNPYGFAIFSAATTVLAAGGPGELFRDSVFPNGCFGALGLALEAGMDVVNLTEHQFGIGTRREGFPWNLSGTYVQAIPGIFSVDHLGQEHDFLGTYYRTTQELASNVFRKGYQWPFHATRMLDFGSSLVDLAIYREGQLGRRVFMDFNRNPPPVPGDLPFSLDRLDPDVTAYLQSAGANQALPIDRLRHMNPLSIELYRRYKVDIAAQPLEFAVNHQHMNGGIAVDVWGRSSLCGCYAIGEAAGTHGVTRPGGAALNSGQVFGTRVAEHVASLSIPADLAIPSSSALQAIGQITALVDPGSALTPQILRDSVQSRMSDTAGILCRADTVAQALAEARALNAEIRAQGIRPDHDRDIARLVQRQHMALASEAVLTALDHYIRQGGGSRGARAICDAQGECLPMAASGPLADYRFRKEQALHKSEQIILRMTKGGMETLARPNRSLATTGKPFFERDWPHWLTGEIYRSGSAKEAEC